MNKVTVYFANHEEIKTKFDIDQKLADGIAPHYKDQLATVKNEHRKVELLCSGLLLKHVLGFSQDTDFHISKFGALSTKEGMRNFCISHARDYTILAVANSDITVGADLEELHDDMSEKQIHHRQIVGKKVFPPALMEQYCSAPASQEPLVFTTLWTQVEAALKAEGNGFYMDPLKHPELFTKWKFDSISYDGHIATIATLPFADDEKIIIVEELFTL